MLKKGDIVTIYEDPITCRVVEGTAKLIRKEVSIGNGLEMWSVKFLRVGVDDVTLCRILKAE